MPAPYRKTPWWPRKEAYIVILVLLRFGIATPMAVANAADTLQDKTCIFAAAAKLPSVPGLEIMHSSTGPVPAEVTQTGPYYGAVNPVGGSAKAASMIVHLDVQAAAQSATFEFVCAYNNEATVATPLGVTK